jgi:hypothetical protein
VRVCHCVPAVPGTRTATYTAVYTVISVHLSTHTRVPTTAVVRMTKQVVLVLNLVDLHTDLQLMVNLLVVPRYSSVHTHSQIS